MHKKKTFSAKLKKKTPKSKETDVHQGARGIGHRTSFHRYMKIETSCILSDQDRIKLNINTNKNYIQYTNP